MIIYIFKMTQEFKILCLSVLVSRSFQKLFSYVTLVSYVYSVLWYPALEKPNLCHTLNFSTWNGGQGCCFAFATVTKNVTGSGRDSNSRLSDVEKLIMSFFLQISAKAAEHKTGWKLCVWLLWWVLRRIHVTQVIERQMKVKAWNWRPKETCEYQSHETHVCVKVKYWHVGMIVDSSFILVA